jgi:hypothetical protein
VLCEVLVREAALSLATSSPQGEKKEASAPSAALWFPAMVHRHEPWRGRRAFQVVIWIGPCNNLERPEGRAASADGAAAADVEPLELDSVSSARDEGPPRQSAHLWCELPSPAVRLAVELDGNVGFAAVGAPSAAALWGVDSVARSRGAASSRIPRAVADWAAQLADCDAAAHLAAQQASGDGSAADVMPLPAPSVALGDAQAAVLAPFLARRFVPLHSGTSSKSEFTDSSDEQGEGGALSARSRPVQARTRERGAARLRGTIVERLERQLRQDLGLLFGALPSLLAGGERRRGAPGAGAGESAGAGGAESFESLRSAVVQIARLADVSVGWTVAAPLLPESVAHLVAYHKSRLRNHASAVLKTEERLVELAGRVAARGKEHAAEMAALQLRDDAIGPKLGDAKATIAAAKERRALAAASVRVAEDAVAALRPSVEAAEAACTRIVSAGAARFDERRALLDAADVAGRRAAAVHAFLSRLRSTVARLRVGIDAHFSSAGERRSHQKKQQQQEQQMAASSSAALLAELGVASTATGVDAATAAGMSASELIASEFSFIYRYISHESCSQFDSLTLTSFPLQRERRSSSRVWVLRRSRRCPALAHPSCARRSPVGKARSSRFCASWKATLPARRARSAPLRALQRRAQPAGAAPSPARPAARWRRRRSTSIFPASPPT